MNLHKCHELETLYHLERQNRKLELEVHKDQLVQVQKELEDKNFEIKSIFGQKTASLQQTVYLWPQYAEIMRGHLGVELSVQDQRALRQMLQEMNGMLAMHVADAQN
jgi:uncharacterized protein involved in exopolysaccharide biosynthesis